MKLTVFLFLFLLFSIGPAGALGIVESQSAQNVQAAQSERKEKHGLCDIFGLVEVPVTGEVSGCDDRTKAAQKRAWHWLTQSLGGGSQAKSCGHFQQRLEEAAADLRKAQALCKDPGSVKPESNGAMLVRNTQAKEVKDSAIAHLSQCVLLLETAEAAAANQTLPKKQAKPPFKDPFTAADLERQVKRDTERMQRLAGKSYQDARLKARCDSALKGSIRAMEKIRSAYGEVGAVNIFGQVRDRARMEKASAATARNALSSSSAAKPKPLSDTDPRWAK